MQGKVEEYCALAEEVIACGYDADRCERDAELCALDEHQRREACLAIADKARARMAEIADKVIELAQEVGA